MANETEAEAVARIATDASAARQTPALGGPEQGWGTYYIPGAGFLTADETQRLPVPPRPQGRVEVYTAESFMAVLEQRKLNGRPSTAYADDDRKWLTAILNDDSGDTAGWRDYQVALVQRRTPEWQAWLDRNEQLHGQESFAELLEDRASQVIDPDPATMIEIAQTLQGTMKVDWAAGGRLQDGSRQLRWTETVDARAGQTGELAIPPSFMIKLPLFRGGPDALVTVALRFRIGPPLKFLYKVLDVDRLEREAFEEAVDQVRQTAGAPTIIIGPAPDEA
jgi:uncharacterized protein YfdQ (DUF2303 family)